MFRWTNAPQRQPKLCLIDCLEQLSAILALPQIPNEDGPQGFRVLEELHRLLRDVHIQVERAMSQRSENGAGGSVGSRCTGGALRGGIGKISSLRDGCASGCAGLESLCMRCAQVPAALCVTCAQGSSGLTEDVLPAVGGLRAGCLVENGPTNGLTAHRQPDAHRCGWGVQGARNPCRLRPHRPRLRVPISAAQQSPLALTQAAAPDAKEVNAPQWNTIDSLPPAGRLRGPQQFYIGDDEAWRCDDPNEAQCHVQGAPWQSEPGLPVPCNALGLSPKSAFGKRHAASMLPPALWATQAEEEECNPVERAQMVAQLRRQLHSLSEHSRHLLTVPLTGQATERGSSSTGGTFREFLHACTSEDMVLIPPSCLEARRRLPEAPLAEVLLDHTVNNGVDCPRATVIANHAKAKDMDDDRPALMQLPIPPACRDDDEECECERYAVSRQRDGRLIWMPETLPAG